ncbi:CbiX/SirB N-terminal domain-containing protein [Paenibacillus sp. LHD-38]|uniref:sirohydrochlorin chelatase n=1 Tax=Paenibacillus sp. LHD-38 TaxID=3072143 RepID=UPI00280DBC20|nr:CbiX/SirB N-terminal domain-containing protein [Paenibacillus sp. LHD-38]MDQ8733917.1 CbiX/SirB N-terminal domain-containing protein [Paenibacillus sp. LHD-38]
MKPGILVISHGSREAAWVKLVDDAVIAAAASPCLSDIPIVSSFLEIIEGRLIQDGIDELERQGVTDMYVVPFFISSGSTHVDEIGQAFGLPWLTDLEGDLGTFRVSANVRYGLPIDDDPEIAELLAANIAELSTEPEKEALLLIGHGSKEKMFHERWQEGLLKLGERLRALGGYKRAEYAMLLPDQAAAKLAEMQAANPGEAVIVVPLFLSRGYFTNHVIPTRLTGLEYRYNGKAMLPNQAIERWLERQMLEGLQRLNEK